MSTLMERIEADYKSAMKAQERVRIQTLRLIKAAAQRAAMDKRKDALDDPEIVQVLSQQAKQRQETIDAATKNNRPEIAAEATEELRLISAYLPERLSAEAIKRLIEEAINAVGTQQGPIIKHVMAKAAGAADGKQVSQLVAERLRQGTAA